jgi:hypothetical protein
MQFEFRSEKKSEEKKWKETLWFPGIAPRDDKET